MRWKLIVIGFAGLLVAVIIAAYAILLSYDFNQLKPEIVAQVKAATGRDLSLGGDIKLQVSFNPTLVVEKVELANASWGTRKQMLSAKKLEVQIELLPLIFSEIKLDRLVIIGPDVLIEIDKDGRSNLDFAPQAGPDKAPQKAQTAKPEPAASGQAMAEKKLSLPLLVFRELRIDNGLVTYLNHQNGEKHKLSLQTLKGSLPGMDKPVTLETKGALDEQSFALSGKVGSLSGLTGGGAPWPVEVKLIFRGAELGIKGLIKEPLKGEGLDLAIKAKGDDLAKLGPAAGLGGPFGLECKLSDSKPKVYKLSGLKLNAQGSDLAGWLQADVSGKRPVIVAELKAGVLDVLRLSGGSGQAKSGQAESDKAKVGAAGQTPEAAKAKGKAPAQRSSSKKKVFSSDPLPLETIKQFDADIKLSAQKVRHYQLALDDLNFQVKLAGGRLSLQPLTGKLNGGELKASFLLAPQGKSAQVELKLELAGCQAGELLAGLGQNKIVEAPLDVNAVLAGSGTSIAGIMAGLNGKLILALQKGKISNQYLEVAGGDLGPVLGNIITPAAKGKPHTGLNCMVMGFRVVNGLAKSNVILLNTENMVVLGEGKVNLGSEELDLVMHPSPKKSLTQKATGGLAGISLGELTKPFKLTGTLAQPRVGIDEVGAITTIAKTVGGYAILGPFGAAAGALTSSGTGEEAGCDEALAAAHSGGKFEPKPAKDQSQTGTRSEGQKESGQDKFKKDIEEGVNSIKKLFGN